MIFRDNKKLVFIGSLLMGAFGYWQGIHLESWGQLVSVQNFIGLGLTLGSVILGNHASSVWVNTNGTKTPPKP